MPAPVNQAQDNNLNNAGEDIEARINKAEAQVIDQYLIDLKRQNFFKQFQAVIEGKDSNLQGIKKFLHENEELSEICSADSSTNFFVNVVASSLESKESEKDKLDFIKAFTKDMKYLESSSASKDEDFKSLLVVYSKNHSSEKFGQIVDKSYKDSIANVDDLQGLSEDQIAEYIKKRSASSTNQASSNQSDPENDQNVEMLQKALAKERRKKKSLLDDVEPKDVAKAGFSLAALIALSVTFPGFGTVIGLVIAGAVYSTGNAKTAEEENIKSEFDLEELSRNVQKSKPHNISSATSKTVEEGQKVMSDQTNKLESVKQDLSSKNLDNSEAQNLVSPSKVESVSVPSPIRTGEDLEMAPVENISSRLQNIFSRLPKNREGLKREDLDNPNVQFDKIYQDTGDVTLNSNPMRDLAKSIVVSAQQGVDNSSQNETSSSDPTNLPNVQKTQNNSQLQ